jgi:hypothetical protein
MRVWMKTKRRRALPSANRPPPAGNPNRLLAALPAADYARILPSLTVVPLKLKNVLHKPGESIQDVYFPGGGFCSMLTVLEDGGWWRSPPLVAKGWSVFQPY